MKILDVRVVIYTSRFSSPSVFNSADATNMLLFASLLWITALAVDKTSPQSRPIRRLQIFESFTELHDEQPDDLSRTLENEYSTLDSDDEGTVNVILSRLLIDFHVPETLQLPQCLDGVRASQNEGQIRDLMVFQSLLMMLTNPKDSQALFPWQQYLAKSLRNQNASVINLCSEYKQHFRCEHEHLTFINVDGKGLFDHLNLLKIPNTVRVFSAERCKLKTISPWSDLKGKSLECLRLKDNADLNLDLHGLTGNSDHLPLNRLVVSKVSISNYFGLQPHHRRDLKSSGLKEWMKKSTLECMKVLRNGHQPGHKRNPLCFYRDGTWTQGREMA